MNYFAHGLRFVDRPHYLAGTAVPDWLSVADRRVRMRNRGVEPWVDGSGSVADEIAGGVLRHLEDDQWFHRTLAFHEVTGELARLFREALGPEDGFRPGFLGHIVTEMLLDGVLIERHPGRLDAYYAALRALDARTIEKAVNRMARHQTNRLASLIGLFCESEFLRDYCSTSGLQYRLNQVLRRVRLNPLPEEVAGVLDAGRNVVRARCDDLLPADLFGTVP